MSAQPVDVYQQIIDHLVHDTPSVGARLVLEEGIFSKAPDQAHLNELLQSLDTAQRETLATMLSHEQMGALHDVLAALTWWIDCRDVGLTWRGQPMPVQLSGRGLHGDYIGRLDDWQGPEGDEAS